MNNFKSLIISSMILFFITSTVSYNILGIFPAFSKSHSILGIALMEGLASAGHNVTIITPYPKSEPSENLRYISLKEEMELATKTMPTFVKYKELGLWERYRSFFDLTPWVTNFTLHSSTIKNFLNDPNEQFDLVIFTVVLNDAMLGVAHHFKAPIIGFTTLVTSKWVNDLVGNPTPFSYVPHMFLPFTERMTFWERLENVLFYLYEIYLFEWYHMPQQTEIYNEHFPDPKPSLAELRKSISLVLVNSHHSILFPRPYVPNMIEIGGINVDRQDDALPSEVQEILDNATQGAIYFSLGTNVRFDTIDKKVLNDILTAFAKLKQTVIWKLDIDDIPNKPKNIYINKWFPQNAILAHPNIRAFISHGGMLSITEAIYYGVPIIGIPFIVDQELNVKQAEYKGYAVIVRFSDLTEEHFSAAINEILQNEKYTITVKEISKRYRDQPMSPLKTAIYWIEYVIRHQGAPHLRSAGQDLNWIQYHSLDVFVFLFAILLFALYFVKIVSNFCLKIYRTITSTNKDKIS